MNINYLTGSKLFLNISEALKVSQKTDSTVNDLEKYKKEVSADEIKYWNNNDKDRANNCSRWDLDKIPLKIFVSKNVNNERFLPEFINAVKSCFQPWSRASYGLIRFEETLNINNADIIITWSDNVVFGRDFEVGQNNLKVINNKIEKAEITIIVYPIIDRLANPASRIERVRRTTLHEIGHALGLNHSNSSKDIMFHRGINNKNLSSNDIRRLNELYNSKDPDILI
ncbi:MAG: hypothetical protein A2287_02260 [Candidatus Melainabacteria bacterium RIFOXYA12_FULL_32_12]|nr:MAG: hypothetical protein A2255_10285 [Candidatus Melainabacteria bacterium RIFOXYA2_FULL_32_9]OGI30505.1 MAG: hypothetical protein A2287_02260 [Candidatus Melainabacteria bacterium RIFOXYA12_FULL_32_12]